MNIVRSFPALMVFYCLCFVLGGQNIAYSQGYKLVYELDLNDMKVLLNELVGDKHRKDILFPYNFRYGSKNVMFFDSMGKVVKVLRGVFPGQQNLSRFIFFPVDEVNEVMNNNYVLVEDVPLNEENFRFCRDESIEQRSPLASYRLFDKEGNEIWSKEDVATDKIVLFRGGNHVAFAGKWNCWDGESVPNKILIYNTGGQKVSENDLLDCGGKDGILFGYCLGADISTLTVGQSCGLNDTNRQCYSLDSERPTLKGEAFLDFERTDIYSDYLFDIHGALRNLRGKVIMNLDSLRASTGMNVTGFRLSPKGKKQRKRVPLIVGVINTHGERVSMICEVSISEDNEMRNVSGCAEVDTTEGSPIFTFMGGDENDIVIVKPEPITRREGIHVYGRGKVLKQKVDLNNHYSNIEYLSDKCFISHNEQSLRIYCR